MIRATTTVTKPPRHTVWISNNHHRNDGPWKKTKVCRTCTNTVSTSFAIKYLAMWARGYIQSVMLYQQVLPLPTPTGLYARFWWMPVKEYDLSARRIEGSHQEGNVGKRKDNESEREYVPEIMSASKSLIKCWTIDSVKHNQTRLKLNCVIRSTLYIQVEECLSVSQYHHYARVGRWSAYGVAVPFGKINANSAAKCLQASEEVLRNS